MALIGVFAVSCSDDDDKAEIGEPFSKVEGMDGTWTIGMVNQIDEQSVLRDAKDLSEYFIIPGEQALEMTFDDGDFTYDVVPGTGSNPFGDGGTWTFDDIDYPTELWLMPTDQSDTLSFALGQPVYAHSPDLYLNLNKYCVDGATGDEVLILAYEYKFIRQ